MSFFFFEFEQVEKMLNKLPFSSVKASKQQLNWSSGGRPWREVCLCGPAQRGVGTTGAAPLATFRKTESQADQTGLKFWKSDSNNLDVSNCFKFQVFAHWLFSKVSPKGAQSLRSWRSARRWRRGNERLSCRSSWSGVNGHGCCGWNMSFYHPVSILIFDWNEYSFVC